MGETPQRVEVDVPFNLEGGDLAFTDVDQLAEPIIRQLMWLRDSHFEKTEQAWEDAELGRIFLAAGLLHAKYPAAPVRDCLEQAIVWERG